MIENLRYLSTAYWKSLTLNQTGGQQVLLAKRGGIVCTQAKVFPLRAKRKNPGSIPSFVVNKPFNLGMDS